MLCCDNRYDIIDIEIENLENFPMRLIETTIQALKPDLIVIIKKSSS